MENGSAQHRREDDASAAGDGALRAGRGGRAGGRRDGENHDENGIVRVIVVGRTGLEAQLRLDPGVELVRAKSTLEAVGELGEAMADERRAGEGDAEQAGDGAANVVVVAAELDPGTKAGEWIESIRVVDPGARVLLAQSNGAGTETPDARGTYDGVVRVGSSAEEVRRIVRRSARSAHDDGGFDRVEREGSAAETGGTAAAARSGGSHIGEDHAERDAHEADDVRLVRVMLTGADVGAAAMQIVRERVGAEDVVFLAADGGGVPDMERTREGMVTAAVRHNGRVLGWVRSGMCAGAKAARLEKEAAWLGAWLALGEQHAQLRRAAFTDDLTGAYNRRYFDRYLARAIEQAAASRSTVTVLFLDLDNFKRFNDCYGHGAGDEILKETVRLLSSVIRPSDRVCRVGGDEFAVIFHEPGGARAPGSKPPDSVGAMTKRFQKQICESRFPKLGSGAPGTLTVSGGLATYPWDGRTADELLERADQLAIESKRQGKNAILMGPGAARECGGE